jgi:hypothetical protein
MARLPPAPPAKAISKKKQKNILSFYEPASPKRKKRPASPPHEEVLADNPDIAFIVMFRSRFTDAFPPKCPHFGPQDIERGVVDPVPPSQLESLLCALLGLVLNRKKPVEKGHYGRALEEAIQTQKHQWPRAWNGANPLSGGRSFNAMNPQERLTLLKSLILWSLNTSETIGNILKDGYKSRTSKIKEDINIPLSVQPWGRDGDKRRYWLVEGQDDTAFRVYRESNPVLKNNTWWSVAGTIDELRTLSQKLLNDDGTREAKALSERILNAIPRFEATEEKRKRREYRLARKAAFTRPEPGFSLYEGRTRGKRMKYTFSDDEDETSDATSVRRSARQSGRDTPAGPTGPTVTASGRHVRSRASGLYGESLLSGQATGDETPGTGEYMRSDASEEPHPAHGRATRAAAQVTHSNPKKRKHIETYNSVDEMDDEDEASSSGGEWEGGDEVDVDHMDQDDEDDEMSDSDSVMDNDRSLVVKLKYRKSSSVQPSQPIQEGINVVPKTSSVLALGQPASEKPAQPAPQAQRSSSPAPNGLQAQQTPDGSATTTQQTTPPSEYAPSKLEVKHEAKSGVQFSAPTPPYAVSENGVAKHDFALDPKSDAHHISTTAALNPTPTSTL